MQNVSGDLRPHPPEDRSGKSPDEDGSKNGDRLSSKREQCGQKDRRLKQGQKEEKQRKQGSQNVGLQKRGSLKRVSSGFLGAFVHQPVELGSRIPEQSPQVANVLVSEPFAVHLQYVKTLIPT